MADDDGVVDAIEASAAPVLPGWLEQPRVSAS
jgi:hypothetical protein